MAETGLKQRNQAALLSHKILRGDNLKIDDIDRY